MKFRNELKQYINESDYLILKSRLAPIAKRDSHVGADGKYRIRSLYFENTDDKALREKLEGVYNREKFRIRYYNDDFGYIKLEKKTKVNGYGNKISEPLTKKECEWIIAGETEWMKYSGRALLVELYCKMKEQDLRPRTIVDYDREPFIFPAGNVRVTIDSNIKTGIQSTDFFNQGLATIKPLAGNIIILEIKYDEFLPDIIRSAVQLGNRKSCAFSKYAVCRMYG